MYKIFTSLWSKSSVQTNRDKRSSAENETIINEDDWVFISPTSKRVSSAERSIVSPALIKTPQAANVQHFNPIENLLIEHASMSVYEQIAVQTRHRRHRKRFDDEASEGDDNDEEDDDDNDNDDQSSIVFQFQSEHSNTISIDQPTLSVSMEQNRHSHRFHQRRKRSLLKSNSLEKSNQSFNKFLERQRLNAGRSPKFVLHQPSRSKH